MPRPLAVAGANSMRVEVGSWRLGVGSGWQLGIGRWELMVSARPATVWGRTRSARLALHRSARAILTTRGHSSS